MEKGVLKETGRFVAKESVEKLAGYLNKKGATFSISEDGFVASDDRSLNVVNKAIDEVNNTRPASFISLSQYDLMYCVAGWLFSQAPDNAPRNAEKIMSKVREYFEKESKEVFKGHLMKILPEDQLYSFVDTMMKSIKEFRELNLSKWEIAQGIDVDDENRSSGIVFTDGYTSIKDEHNFVDLDAFVQNVVHSLKGKLEKDRYCSGCVRKNTSWCDSCRRNEKDLKDNYKLFRGCSVFNNYCLSDCVWGRIICCSDCDRKGDCADKCRDDHRYCGRHRADEVKK